MTLFIGGVSVGFWRISKYIWRIAAILLAVMAQFIGDVSVGFWQIIGIHMAHSNIMVGDNTSKFIFILKKLKLLFFCQTARKESQRVVDPSLTVGGCYLSSRMYYARREAVKLRQLVALDTSLQL